MKTAFAALILAIGCVFAYLHFGDSDSIAPQSVNAWGGSEIKSEHASVPREEPRPVETRREPVKEPVARPTVRDQKYLKLESLAKERRWKELLELLDSTYSGPLRERVLMTLLAEIGSEDFEAIPIFYRAFRDKPLRGGSISLLAQKMLDKGKLESLLTYTESNTTGELKNEIIGQAIKACCLSRGNLELAVQTLERLPFSFHRTSAITDVAAAYARLDPSKGIAWASSLGVAEDRNRAFSGLVTGFQINKDMNSLRLLSREGDAETKGGSMYALGVIAMEQGRPISEVLAEYQNENVDPGQVFNGAVSTANEKQLAELEKSIDLIPAGLSRDSAASRVAARKFKFSQKEALEWLDTLPESQKNAATRAIAIKWYNLDSMALSDWVYSKPVSTQTDIAKETIVGLLKATDKAAARDVANSISDQKRKTMALRSIR